MPPTLAAAVSAYGAAARSKFAAAVRGEPEDQLRAPVEALLRALATLAGIPTDAVTVVGETALRGVRPDFAVTVRGAAVGFVELKAPGNGPTRPATATSTTRRSGRS